MLLVQLHLSSLMSLSFAILAVGHRSFCWTHTCCFVAVCTFVCTAAIWGKNENLELPFSEYWFSDVHVYGALEVKCTFAHYFFTLRRSGPRILGITKMFLMGNISVNTDSNFHNCMLSNYQLCAHLSRCSHIHFLQFVFGRMICLVARLGGFQ